MTTETKTIEGKVESFHLTKETHKGPYSNSKEIPVINIRIISKRGIQSCKLPLDVPNNPLSVSLMESELRGQKVTYKAGFKRENEASGSVWYFDVHSGKLAGTHYELEELTDW